MFYEKPAVQQLMGGIPGSSDTFIFLAFLNILDQTLWSTDTTTVAPPPRLTFRGVFSDPSVSTY